MNVGKMIKIQTLLNESGSKIEWKVIKKIKTYLKLKEDTNKAYKAIGLTKQQICRIIKKFNLK